MSTILNHKDFPGYLAKMMDANGFIVNNGCEILVRSATQDRRPYFIGCSINKFGHLILRGVI